MSPTVTCIVNAYDRPELLRGAITSVFAQTHPLHEVIVVDDHSPRDLAPTIAAFGNRVRHLRLSQNGGLTAARNAGVAAATGDVVAFLDDDDEWLPEKIERQVAALTRGYQACLCGWQRLGEDYFRVWDVTEITEDMLRLGNPYCGGTAVMAWREVLLAQRFDPSISQGEDWDMYVRLAQRQPIAYVPRPLFLYRTADHSMTRSARHETPAQRLRRAAALKKHRAWLGERYYHDRLASTILNSFSMLEKKHRYLYFSIRKAGLRATLRYFFDRSVRRNRGVVRRPGCEAARNRGLGSASNRD